MTACTILQRPVFEAVREETFSLQKSSHSLPSVVSKAFQHLAEGACWTAVLVGKALVTPPALLALLAVFVLTVLVTLCCSPLALHPDLSSIIFDSAAGIVRDLLALACIVVAYGLVFNRSEWAQNADKQPQSPKFVLIEPETSSEGKNGIPILYAPGYLDDPETLRLTCRRIANQAGSRVYIVQYRSKFQSIDNHAKDIARVAQRIFQGGSNLVMIGHSMGGLTTGQAMIGNHIDQNKVKLWVTIASPLQGTRMAYLGLGSCAQQMRPNSPFIEEFKVNRASLGVPSMHIQTRSDMIVPFESAKVGNARDFTSSTAEGHLSVRSCGEVEKQIVEKILQFSHP